MNIKIINKFFIKGFMYMLMDGVSVCMYRNFLDRYFIYKLFLLYFYYMYGINRLYMLYFFFIKILFNF